MPATTRSPAISQAVRKQPELRNLTSLRFVAAIMVVLFHIRDSLPFIAINRAIDIGYIGVSFFFVLSGFILAYNYSGTTISFRDFWSARVARIYPIYLVGLLLSLPFFAALVARGAAPWLAAPVAAVLLQAWLPEFALALNAPGWSLSDEAFFYVCFPLVMRRLQGLTARGALWFGVAAWICALLPPIGYIALSGRQGVGPSDHDLIVNVVKFNPAARIGEFIAGMSAGVIFLRRPRRQRPAQVVMASLLIAILISSSDRIPYLLLHNGLFVPAFAGLILALATTPIPILGSQAFGRLGESSYSLYILHVPVWMTLSAIETRQHLFGRAMVAVYLLLVVITSLLAHHYIEVPMRSRLRRPRQPRA